MGEATKLMPFNDLRLYSKQQTDITESVGCIFVCNASRGGQCLDIVDVQADAVLVRTLTLSLLSQSDVAGSHRRGYPFLRARNQFLQNIHETQRSTNYCYII